MPCHVRSKMIGRIIEIVEPRQLYLDYGRLVVKDKDIVLETIDLDSISAVIAYPHGGMYSSGVLAEFSIRRIPFLILGKNYEPVALTLPVIGNTRQSDRLATQIEITEPTRKQAWQQTIKSKIKMQAMALKTVREIELSNRLLGMSNNVQSGDSTNIEPIAAKYYFRGMFGEDFRRERGLGGINSLLNYGYAVMRASVARAVISTGLNPSLGIHHHSIFDHFRLVDDLIEPYRPFVDLRVRRIIETGQYEVEPATKKELISLLRLDVESPKGHTPLGNAPQLTTNSLLNFYEKTGSLWFPSASDIGALQEAYRI